MVSNRFKKEMFDPHSADPFLFLIKMDHDSWANTERLVNNLENIISNGETFLAVPMQIKLPQSEGDTVPQVQLQIDTVNQDLIESIRTITSPIKVELYAVLASNPDIVEVELKEMLISNITNNGLSITATLVLDSFLSQGIPSEHYTPSLYPGLF